MDGQEITTPTSIIFDTLKLVSKPGGREYMPALLELTTPLRDEKWAEDLRSVPRKPSDDELYWHTYGCVIGLLARKGLWVTPPRQVETGKEFEEAL